MIRIQSGIYKGKKLYSPQGQKTRPTSSKTRSAIFDVLESRLTLANYIFYDLFSGSGAVGIEALSRGAKQSVFVENERKASICLQKNLDALKIKASFFQENALHWCRGFYFSQEPSIIFLDPPYYSEYGQEVLHLLKKKKSNEENLVILQKESRKKQDDYSFDGFELLKTKRYGKTQLLFYQKTTRE